MVNLLIDVLCAVGIIVLVGFGAIFIKAVIDKLKE